MFLPRRTSALDRTSNWTIAGGCRYDLRPMGAEAQIRVAGPATQDNTVSAEVLVRAIEGMQQCIWLLATSSSRVEYCYRLPDDSSLTPKATQLN